MLMNVSDWPIELGNLRYLILIDNVFEKLSSEEKHNVTKTVIICIETPTN
jgi:hypothetical protein